MSESFSLQLQNLTNRELINLALESVGDDREAIRHAALVEHYNRAKDAPDTLHARSGDTEILARKFQAIVDREKSNNPEEFS